MLDPFLVLDEFVIDDGRSGAGFPSHPHRGFETVTYMFEGLMTHADNAGHGGTIGPGAAQWMTAGRGIVHSEIPAVDPDGQGVGVRGMQLWVNLPARDKMRAPRYQDIDATDIPHVAIDGGDIAVIAGQYNGVAGPIVEIATQPLYLDISIGVGATVDVPMPAGHAAFLYVVDGSAMIEGQDTTRRSLVVFSDGDHVQVGAGSKGLRAILVAAKPLGEPVARYGPLNRQWMITGRADSKQSILEGGKKCKYRVIAANGEQV